MNPEMKILFVGETWRGSSARSLREALANLPAIEMDDIGEDHYFPKGRSLLVRGTNRLLSQVHRAELASEVSTKLSALRPDVLLVYKGSGITANVIKQAKQTGVFTVNVFPDPSPHAFGKTLKKAMGEYDLVVSTKPFHPPGWASIYGYGNRCVCVQHGYDPAVHYWRDPPEHQDIDVVLAASWKPQYGRLMSDLARVLGDSQISVSIAGPGWPERRSQFPAHWQFQAALFGRAYGEFVRRGKIVIAPLHREVIIGGIEQPGDEDTTRTYELAAAGCFFLHRRTPLVRKFYDEHSEVPMWDSTEELAASIRRYLPDEQARRTMAAAAHARAISVSSIPSRASQVLDHIKNSMEAMKKA